MLMNWSDAANAKDVFLEETEANISLVFVFLSDRLNN